MKIKLFTLVLITSLFGCSENNNEMIEVSSPESKVKVEFKVSDTGQPYYTVKYNNGVVIDTSYLGFEFTNAEAIDSNLKIMTADIISFDETWQMPWGEQIDVKNKYNQLTVRLHEISDLKRQLNDLRDLPTYSMGDVGCARLTVAQSFPCTRRDSRSAAPTVRHGPAAPLRMAGTSPQRRHRGRITR